MYPAADTAGIDREGHHRSTLRRPFYQFVAGSLLALVAVGVVSLYAAHDMARDIALNEARVRGLAFARGVGAPLVNDAVRHGDHAQMSRLNDVLRNRLADRSIVHIKLWDSKDRVLWADEPGLPGKTFRLEPAVQHLFGTNGVVVKTTNESDPENQLEGQLVEVYAGVHDADGVPLVIESYWDTAQVNAASHKIMGWLTPLTLGSLVLFQLTVVPLAVVMVRRLSRAQSDRNRMLRHALSVADLERRRIVANLHDGVIQDLAGLGYSLPIVAAHLPDTKKAQPARRALDNLSAAVDRDVKALRSLISDVYPTDLERTGFVTAVDDLVKSVARSGVQVTTDVTGANNDALPVIQLAYRIIREALRNVVAHSGASRATVTATRTNSEMHVTVTDDGKGLDAQASVPGHLGLQLLRDLLHEVGGSLDVANVPTGGTRLSARFPVQFAGA